MNELHGNGEDWDPTGFMGFPWDSHGNGNEVHGNGNEDVGVGKTLHTVTSKHLQCMSPA